MQQTQNLVLACNPTIRTRDMLGSAQLDEHLHIVANDTACSQLGHSPLSQPTTATAS